MEVLILNGEIPAVSEDFIPKAEEDEFVRDLRQESIETYLRYLTYKIIHFIAVFHGPAVRKGVFEWMRDDVNDYYFINAYHVRYVDGAA